MLNSFSRSTSSVTILRTLSSLARNASALSEARFHKSVKLGEVLCARSIEPFEPSRPCLRRRRDLCKLNGVRERC